MNDPKEGSPNVSGETRPIPGAPPAHSPDQRTADGHHNQNSAVRGSGDQPPESIYKSERDREGAPDRGQ